MIETTSTGAVVFTGNDIQRFQFIALRGALALETCGMKRRGQSAASIVRTLIGSKTRDKTALFRELDAWMVSQGFRPYGRTV